MLVVPRCCDRSGDRLTAVATVSREYQVLIPRDVGERAGIRPGQQIQVFSVGSRLQLVPTEPIRNLRGAFSVSLPGLDGASERAA